MEKNNAAGQIIEFDDDLSTSEEVENEKDKLHGHISALEKMKSKVVRIVNLDESFTTNNLKQLIQRIVPLAENIENMYLQRDETLGLYYAYVIFMSCHDALRTAQCLNHYIIQNGHKLEVELIGPNLSFKKYKIVGSKRTDSPNEGRQDNRSSTIRIVNLNEATTETDLEDLGKLFGPIQKLYLIKDKRTGLCTGSAYIYFKFRKDAAKAISTLHGYSHKILCNNLILKVDWSS